MEHHGASSLASLRPKPGPIDGDCTPNLSDPVFQRISIGNDLSDNLDARAFQRVAKPGLAAAFKSLADRGRRQPRAVGDAPRMGSRIAPLRSVNSAPLDVVGASSYSLRARPEDDGAMWPAFATRCRRALPGRLAWAAALLDPERPLPVICGERQVREFFHWLQGLPNTERVSIGCERQTLSHHGTA